MANEFIADNFSPVGGFHGEDRADNETGIAVFSYITADTLAQVKAAGYFNDLRDKVHQGDVIYCGSKQLDDDSSDDEYTIIYFDSAPLSPSTANLTVNSKDINAA